MRYLTFNWVSAWIMALGPAKDLDKYHAMAFTMVLHDLANVSKANG